MRDGNEMGMSGTFREIKKAERLIHTEIFDEDWTGGETFITTTFDEVNGQTTVAMRVEYSLIEARDGAMNTDLEKGMEETYTELDTFLTVQ